MPESYSLELTEARSAGADVSSIIDQLVEARHTKGMTQAELARATSLPQSVIARFEKKKNAPQLDTLLKIATALDCEIAVIPRP